MGILNYSTSVSVEKTVADIQRILVNFGAKSISIEYGENRKPTGLYFVLSTRFGDREYRMPVNESGVWQALMDDWKKGKITRGYTTWEQAARVAWRITLDWLKFQLTVIQTETVRVDELFLPYMLVAPNKTLYDAVSQEHLALPAPKGVVVTEVKP